MNPSVNVVALDILSIIDNILDESSWGKRYTLFNFDNIEATIYLNAIHAYTRKVSFRVEVKLNGVSTLHVKDVCEQTGSSFHISLDQYKLNLINREVLSAVEYGLKWAMRMAISGNSDTYRQLMDIDRDSYLRRAEALRESLTKELRGKLSYTEIEVLLDSKLDEIDAFPLSDKFKDDITTEFVDKYMVIFEDSFKMIGVEK